MVIGCLSAVGTVAWVRVWTTRRESTPAPSPEVAEATVAVMCLRAFEGRVALFVDGEDLPVEVYDVPIETLPPEEQQRLQNGIMIESEEMLWELLENYNS